MLKVSDLMDGSRYIIRNDIPHIVAQSNPEIRVFDPQTRDYILFILKIHNK